MKNSKCINENHQGGLFRLLAGNLSPGVFRLLQHNLPTPDMVGLLDQLVGKLLQVQRHYQPQRFGGLEIDH